MSMIERVSRRLSEWYGGSDGSEQFIDLLTRIPPPNAGITETRFRDYVVETLMRVSQGDLAPKREAGIQGRGTRLDIHVHFADHDYLITIKKGFNQQKLKNVVGEIDELRATWRATVPGARTYCVLYLFDVHDHKALEPLLTSFAAFAADINARYGKSFAVDWAMPLGRSLRAR